TLAWVKHAGFRGATIEADAPVSGAPTTPAAAATLTAPVTTITTASGTGTTAGGGGVQTITTTTTTTTTSPACTVTRKPDDHMQYEVVFGRAQSLAAAETFLARTHDAGF